MQFNNLALTSWSFEKGDREIPVEELGLSKIVLGRNPVKSTFLYHDDSTWDTRLQDHVRKSAEKAGLSGADIQAYFGVHNGYKKHPEGASPVAMASFPDSDGFMFDMSLGCASVILGAQMAGLHLNDEQINNIMVASVQMIAQYTHNASDGNCLFADSIGALTFSRANKGNMVRYTNIRSDSEFRDMFEFNDEAIYEMKNLHKGKALSAFMVKSFGKQLMEGCRSMKTFPKDLDFVAVSASNYAASEMLLNKINFPIERSGIECLKRVPHMGTNDLLYQLEYGIEEGMIKKGSKVLITGTSLGFSIGTMAIEWGVD